VKSPIWTLEIDRGEGDCTIISFYEEYIETIDLLENISEIAGYA